MWSYLVQIVGDSVSAPDAGNCAIIAEGDFSWGFYRLYIESFFRIGTKVVLVMDI